MRVGVTGHQHLADPSAWPWVRAEIDKVLHKNLVDLVGVSSLAIGADQMFAQAVLAAGGQLEAVVPFEGYDLDFAPDDRSAFKALLSRASAVEVLEPVGTKEEAYLAAGRRVIERTDALVAVWDGEPAAGLGGTADAVRIAAQSGRRIIHINPANRTVTWIA